MVMAFRVAIANHLDLMLCRMVGPPSPPPINCGRNAFGCHVVLPAVPRLAVKASPMVLPLPLRVLRNRVAPTPPT